MIGERMSLMRKWFGPSREDVWRQLSSEIGAQYVAGGFWKGDKVEATHGDWTIVLDTYTVSTGKVVIIFTRLRARFENPSGFRFSVSRAGFFSSLADRLGFQDVQVGFDQFDDEFVIKGNDEDKLRALFANARVRELLEAQPDVHFRLHDGDVWLGEKLPPDVDELEFTLGGVVKDIPRLKLLFDLFAETLSEVEK